MMKQLTEEELYQVDGGGWLEDAVEYVKKLSSGPVGKVVQIFAVIEPLYDVGVGIKKGWNSYNK